MFKVIFKLWTDSNADFPKKILKCKPEVKNCPDNLEIINVIKSYCNNQEYIIPKEVLKRWQNNPSKQFHYHPLPVKIKFETD